MYALNLKGAAMINAQVIKGVQELLEKHGVEQKSDENFGDFVARGLGVSARQAEVVLQSLHDGKTVEEAMQAADINSTVESGDLLIQIARVVGSMLGRMTPKV
jgi:hypothetical protein